MIFKTMKAEYYSVVEGLKDISVKTGQKHRVVDSLMDSLNSIQNSKDNETLIGLIPDIDNAIRNIDESFSVNETVQMKDCINIPKSRIYGEISDYYSSFKEAERSQKAIFTRKQGDAVNKLKIGIDEVSNPETDYSLLTDKGRYEELLKLKANLYENETDDNRVSYIDNVCGLFDEVSERIKLITSQIDGAQYEGKGIIHKRYDSKKEDIKRELNEKGRQQERGMERFYDLAHKISSSLSRMVTMENIRKRFFQFMPLVIIIGPMIVSKIVNFVQTKNDSNIQESSVESIEGISSLEKNLSGVVKVINKINNYSIFSKLFGAVIGLTAFIVIIYVVYCFVISKRSKKKLKKNTRAFLVRSQDDYWNTNEFEQNAMRYVDSVSGIVLNRYDEIYKELFNETIGDSGSQDFDIYSNIKNRWETLKYER